MTWSGRSGHGRCSSTAPAGYRGAPGQAGWHAGKVDTERAETYLRLMAEAGLRRVLGPDPGSSWEYLARVRYVAAALAMLGAVDQKVADAITSNLETALALRSREHRGSLLPHRVRSGQLHLSPPAPGRLRASTRGASARLQAVLSGSLSPAAPAGKASHGKPAERGGPAQAMPVGRMFRLHGRDVDAEMWLLSLIRIPGRTLLAFSGRVNDGPAAGPAAGYFGQIGAVDDRGNSYSVEYSGSVGSGRTADGWLCLVPELPPATRWVELHGVLDKEAFLRVDVAGGATPARLAAEPT